MSLVFVNWSEEDFGNAIVSGSKDPLTPAIAREAFRLALARFHV